MCTVVLCFANKPHLLQIKSPVLRLRILDQEAFGMARIELGAEDQGSQKLIQWLVRDSFLHFLLGLCLHPAFLQHSLSNRFTMFDTKHDVQMRYYKDLGFGSRVERNGIVFGELSGLLCMLGAFRHSSKTRFVAALRYGCAHQQRFCFCSSQLDISTAIGNF